METSFDSSAQPCPEEGKKKKKNTAPSQLDCSSYISELRHRPGRISRNMRRARFERVRAQRTKCIVVKKTNIDIRITWARVYVCAVRGRVPSGSPEMLSAALFVSLPSPLLFPPRCFSSVAHELSANRFRATFHGVSVMEFLPNDGRRSGLFLGSLPVRAVVSKPPPPTPPPHV